MSKQLPEGVAALPSGVFYASIPDAIYRPHQFRVKDPHSRKMKSQCFAKVKAGLKWATGQMAGLIARTSPTGKVHWSTASAKYIEGLTAGGRRAAYIAAVQRVADNLTAKAAGDVTAPGFRELVRGYIDNLTADPDSRQPGIELAPATKTRHLAIIRAICHAAQHEHRIPFDPVGGVKAPKVRKTLTQTLTLEEVRACLAPRMEREPYFLRFALLLYLGLRERSEGLWLKWADYDAARQVMQVREREGENELKSGEREVPVPNELAEILKRTPRKGPFILAENIRMEKPNKRHKKGSPVEDRTDYARFKAYLRKALLPPKANRKRIAETEERVAQITRHSLRHLYARMMSATGVTLPTLKDRLGHNAISTTMIYATGAESYEKLVQHWKRGEWLLREGVTLAKAQ